MRVILFLLLLFFCHLIYAQVEISSGFYHTIVNCGGEAYFVAGRNNSNQLGFETEEEIVNTFTSLNPFGEMESIKAGYMDFSVALSKKGEVFVFGKKEDGISGRGIEVNDTLSMLRVFDMQPGNGYLDSVVQVEVASNAICALLKTGEVVTWGSNRDNLLGANQKNITHSSLPLYVQCKKGGAIQRMKGIKKITAGFLGFYALDSLGYVWGWGHNFSDLYYYANKYKTGIADTLKSIVDISACGEFCLFLSSSGDVYGTNEFRGSVGLDDTVTYKQYIPARYPSRIPLDSLGQRFLSGVVSISAGFSHSVAVVDFENEQIVYAWGDDKFFNAINWNRGGQLALQTDTLMQSIFPLEIARFKKKSTQTLLKAGATAGLTYLVFEDRGVLKVKVAGANIYGKLGLGDEADRYAFEELSGGYCRFQCPFANLGNDRIFCEPFVEELSIPYNSDSILYDIFWYRNDSLLEGEKSNVLLVRDSGAYMVAITDTTRACALSSSRIYVSSKKPDFRWTDKFTCDDTLHFYIQGTVHCRWHFTQKSDSVLGYSSLISVAKNDIEDFEDPLYRLWVKTDGCQRMPVTRGVYNDCFGCSDDTLLNSLVKENCTELSVEGTQTEWYLDLKNPMPYWIGDTVPITVGLKNYLRKNNAGWKMYVSDVDLTCLKKTDTVSLKECEKPYIVSGRVFDAHNNPIESVIYLYYLDDTSAVIYTDVASTNSNGEYSFKTGDGLKKIKAVAKQDTSVYIYFGNKQTFEGAFALNVIASFKSIDLTYDTQVGITESGLSYMLDGNFIIVNSPYDESFELRIIALDGRLLDRYINTEIIDIATMHRGMYIVQTVGNNVVCSELVYFNKY